MLSAKVWTLDGVKADWLRVQGEVAYVRTMVAAHRLIKTLRQQEDQKFNPNHDELGRFTFADRASGGASKDNTSSSRTRLAEAGVGRRPAPLFARWPDATPAQQARLAVADVWARDAIAQTRARDPGWGPVPSLTSSIEGEIAQAHSEARQAETRLAEIDLHSLGGALGPRPGRTASSLADVCFPNGQPVGVRIPKAKASVRTLPASAFEQFLGNSTRGATAIETPASYRGQWYRHPNDDVVGVRLSSGYGLTVDVIRSRSTIIPPRFRVHHK